MRLLRAAAMASLLSGPAIASADTFARPGNIVIGAAEVVAATGVARREPYYAWREERRRIAAIHVQADVFPIARLSLGGAIGIGREHSPMLGATTLLDATARVGYALGPIWPGVFGGVRHDRGFRAVAGFDLRLVLRLNESVLMVLGPRLEVSEGERTGSLVFGFAGVARTDGVPRVMGRGRFGHKNMRVAELSGVLSMRASRLTMGLDGFLWNGASIGSWAGATTMGTGASRITALVAGARVGQAIIFNDRLWWWPRVGFELARAHAAVADAPNTVIEAVAGAPFVAAIARGVGLAIGPWIAMPLVGSHVRKTSIGLESALVFYF